MENQREHLILLLANIQVRQSNAEQVIKQVHVSSLPNVLDLRLRQNEELVDDNFAQITHFLFHSLMMIL